MPVFKPSPLTSAIRNADYSCAPPKQAPPERLYRFFQTQEHADCFLNGSVRVSTLKTCRNYEDPEQGDPGEATIRYDSGIISGKGKSPDVALIGSRLGFNVSNSDAHITFRHNTVTTRIEDGYVLCTTKKYDPSNMSDAIGKFCVEILDPAAFFSILNQAMLPHLALFRFRHDHITYRERYYRGTQHPPGELGFVKPPDPYAPQEEYRMIWVPMNAGEISPFFVSAQGVSCILKQIGP